MLESSNASDLVGENEVTYSAQKVLFVVMLWVDDYV